MATFVARRATDDIRRSIEYYQVWWFLALDDISARYRNTLLGPFWNAAYIVTQAIALSLVFGGVLHQPLKIFLPYVLSGMVGWALGPATILECAGLLIWFSGTIKTQNFPFLFYAFRIVARSGLMFLHNLVALAVIFSLFGHVPIVNLTLIPAVLLMLLLSVPYSLLIGMLCARYRDIQVFVGNFASVLFVVTPIIWTPSNAPGARSAAYVAYNPFFYLVDLIREPLQNHFAPIQDWVVCGGVAAAGWALCFLCLSVFRSRIAFWV